MSTKDSKTIGQAKRERLEAKRSEKGFLFRKEAIELKCLDCCGYQWVEVRECAATGCPLWPYRKGGLEKPQM